MCTEKFYEIHCFHSVHGTDTCYACDEHLLCEIEALLQEHDELYVAETPTYYDHKPECASCAELSSIRQSSYDEADVVNKLFGLWAESTKKKQPVRAAYLSNMMEGIDVDAVPPKPDPDWVKQDFFKYPLI